MSSVVISGDTSGAITLIVPTTAGTSTLTLPSGASGTIAAQGVSTNIVSGTAVSANATNIDFTSIPSWAKRITVMFNGVSANGSSGWLIRLGTSGGVESTGYAGAGMYQSSAVSTVTNTVGIFLNTLTTGIFSGAVSINLVGSNTWVANGSLGGNGSNGIYTGSSKTLSGTLDRVRITTANGTDAFNAGSINILYE
jgi:hypothetical protein